MDGPRTPGRAHTVLDSPLGPLTLLATDGRLSGLYLRQRRHPPPADAYGEPDAALFTEVAEQLRAYFEGRLTCFDVPLALAGTPFQQQVWAALLEIPYGETVSYRELAERIGRPTAARAVGAANGRNPVSIVVPCHRVLGSDGRLVGYGGGPSTKLQLLTLEREFSGRWTSGAAGPLGHDRDTDRDDHVAGRSGVRSSNEYVR